MCVPELPAGILCMFCDLEPATHRTPDLYPICDDCDISSEDAE